MVAMHLVVRARREHPALTVIQNATGLIICIPYEKISSKRSCSISRSGEAFGNGIAQPIHKLPERLTAARSFESDPYIQLVTAVRKRGGGFSGGSFDAVEASCVDGVAAAEGGRRHAAVGIPYPQTPRASSLPDMAGRLSGRGSTDCLPAPSITLSLRDATRASQGWLVWAGSASADTLTGTAPH